MLRPHLKLLSSIAIASFTNGLLIVDIPLRNNRKLWQFAIATACYRRTDVIEA